MRLMGRIKNEMRRKRFRQGSGQICRLLIAEQSEDAVFNRHILSFAQLPDDMDNINVNSPTKLRPGRVDIAAEFGISLNQRDLHTKSTEFHSLKIDRAANVQCYCQICWNGWVHMVLVLGVLDWRLLFAHLFNMKRRSRSRTLNCTSLHRRQTIRIPIRNVANLVLLGMCELMADPNVPQQPAYHEVWLTPSHRLRSI